MHSFWWCSSNSSSGGDSDGSSSSNNSGMIVKVSISIVVQPRVNNMGWYLPYRTPQSV